MKFKYNEFIDNGLVENNSEQTQQIQQIQKYNKQIFTKYW